MVTKGLSLVIAVIAAGSTIAPRQANGQMETQGTKAEQQVRALREELSGALRRRDRAALERLIAVGFTFIHANGVIENRNQYIDAGAAGTQTGQRAGSESFWDDQLRIYEEHTAVWTRRSGWRLNDGTELHLRSTNLYTIIGGRWQLVFAQSVELPARPKANAIDPSVYSGYVGQYEISPGRTFTVTYEGGVLKGMTTGRAAGELIPKPETEFIWFNADVKVDAQAIFIKAGNGQTTHVAFRMNGNEVWRAKKVP